MVDFPKDILSKEVEFKPAEKVEIRGYKPTYKGNVRQIERVLDEVSKAKKPVIYAGGGVILSDASKELRLFAKKTNIPVTMTLMGLGCFPGTDPMSLGMIGMHGTFRANMAVTNCDLLIAIGARFDDRITGDINAFA